MINLTLDGGGRGNMSSAEMGESGGLGGTAERG